MDEVRSILNENAESNGNNYTGEWNRLSESELRRLREEDLDKGSEELRRMESKLRRREGEVS